MKYISRTWENGASEILGQGWGEKCSILPFFAQQPVAEDGGKTTSILTNIISNLWSGNDN